MNYYKIPKIIKSAETYEIVPGVKIFADYTDFSYDNDTGTSVTLKGKFTDTSVSNGDKAVLIITEKHFPDMEMPPTDEQLLTFWFAVDTCIVQNTGDDLFVQYTIADCEYAYFSFAFYIQQNITFTKKGDSNI